MKHKPGDRVLIIEDCREGSPTTGQIGVYEGMFPISVFLHDGENFLPGEWNFEEYDSGRLAIATDGVSIKELYPLWVEGEERPEGPFALANENPRIRLEDGSVIWGCQCWWGQAETRGIATAINAVCENDSGEEVS